MVLAFVLQVPGDKSIVPEGGTEHGDPMALWWERPVPDPDWLGAVISTQVGDVARLLAGGLPDPRFALMKTNPCTVPQGGC